MTENEFLNKKSDRKKRANKFVWILLGFSAFGIAMLIKVMLTGSLKPEFFKGLPTHEDAYEIAKEYVRPTLKSSSVNFEEEGYQFGKTSDSVYVIKSTLETEGTTMEFKITLQYKGGQPDKQKNWSVVSLNTY